MRPGQNRRMRGRNRSKGPNPLTRSYESNGPDVKIRGTAQHIADKYAQLARDAQASGDPVSAENYFQHAEHYYRLIAAAQEQFRTQYGTGPRPFDEDGDEGDEEAGGGFPQGGDRMGGMPDEFADGPGFGPQPYEQRGGERPQQQRFDRNDRQNRQQRFDRNANGGQERGERYDRQNGPDRQNDRYERHNGERYDRQNGERYERQAGGERGGGQERGDRYERQDRRDRFPREGRPERDFQAEGRDRRPDRGAAQFRQEPRYSEPEEDRDTGAPGLPAFLTTPVRHVVAEAEPEPMSVAPEPNAIEAIENDAPAPTGVRPRRRRTRKAETVDAGAEIASETSQDGTAD